MGQRTSSLTAREKTLLSASAALEKEDIPNRLLAAREDLENGLDTFGDVGEHVELMSIAITNTCRLHTLAVELLRALLEEQLNQPVKKATLQILSGKTLSRSIVKITSLLEEDSFWDRNETARHTIISAETWRIVEELEAQIKMIKEMFRSSDLKAFRAERARMTLHELAKDGQTNAL